MPSQDPAKRATARAPYCDGSVVGSRDYELSITVGKVCASDAVWMIVVIIRRPAFHARFPKFHGRRERKRTRGLDRLDAFIPTHLNALQDLDFRRNTHCIVLPKTGLSGSDYEGGVVYMSYRELNEVREAANEYLAIGNQIGQICTLCARLRPKW